MVATRYEKVNIVVKFLFPHFIFINPCYTGVQFSFEPSQAIIIQQTAVYKCSVDNEGITIQWHVNEYLSTLTYITDLGIHTYGDGTRNSSLTIPGNPELNNTIVKCIASGLVNMMGYFNTSSATLFIQGTVLVYNHDSIHCHLSINKYRDSIHCCSNILNIVVVKNFTIAHL